MKVLVVFESDHGQAEKVARRLADQIRSAGHQVGLARASARPAVEQHDAIVVGGSVHIGDHQKSLVEFCRANRDAITARPNAFFSVSVSARRRPAGAQAEVAKAFSRFIRATAWVPERLWPVAGALKYTRYPAHIRALLVLIARLSHGDTDTSRDWEYTDWAAVDATARTFARSLKVSAREAA